MKKSDYPKYSKNQSPPSPIFKNCLMAFLVGGFICMFGQYILFLLQKAGLPEKEAEKWVPIFLILLSCLLTGIGIFDKIAKKAGAGTLVPITGFANAMCSPAIDNKAEGFILGLAAKMFVIAGPVIVYGTVASVIYGIIYWIATLF